MFPEKANISLAHVAARDHLKLRVWERGVGLTQACGSAACAALVAAVRDGLTERKAQVTLPGGDLTIEWREADGHALMTGPVELESETTIAL
jgi:diaminopimelate epimerase